MPWLLVSCLFALSLMLMLQSIFKGSAETCDYQISTKEGAGILLLSVVVIGYIYSLDFIGFLLATPIFLAILKNMLYRISIKTGSVSEYIEELKSKIKRIADDCL